MKVVHITTIDIGGAYKAAVRLHEGLTRIGVQSEILLRTKTEKIMPALKFSPISLLH